jgi:hypothetical protein
VSPGICSEVERYAKGYNYLATRLFTAIADPEAEGRYFEPNLRGIFVNDVRRMFLEMLAERGQREKELAELNPHLTPSQVTTLAAQLSMGIFPTPQPAPESPGGSGES